MLKIDKTDKKLLFELDRDARRSVNELAKALGINRDTAAYRIKRLEKLGIIQGYYTLIDFAKLGYTLVRLYLKFQDTSPEIEERIIQYFVKEKTTLGVYRAEGTWDVTMGFLVKRLDDFDSLYKKFQMQFKRYIYKENISIFLEFVHYLRKYLAQEGQHDKKSFSTGKAAQIPLDETDLRMLRLLATDARLSLLDMAQQFQMTSMAVKYRLHQLEKKQVILAYRAMIDYNLLGYGYYKVDLVLENVDVRMTLAEFARQHPNVVYEDRTIGGSDFEFDIEVQDIDELYAIIESIKRTFPGIVRTYQYYKARHAYKYEYIPQM